MLRIREMNLGDVSLGCRLSDSAGWNQLATDWQRLITLEPAGCFLAEWEGRPVGTTCVTRFDTIAWISMVLVDAAYRGRGIGTRLMRMRWFRSIGAERGRCDWMPPRWDGQCMKNWASWASTRWPAGKVRPSEGKSVPEITMAADVHLEAIAALDHEATGTPRGTLLARVFAERPKRMRVAMTVGRISGFSGVRLGRRARQIGPVVALEASSGAGLLATAFADHQGQAVFLDVPLPNRPAMRWAEERGLRIQRQFLRMARGRPVADRPEQIWASFGPEKG